jgi:hypothetical protein
MTHSIAFPALAYFRGSLVALPEETARVIGLRFVMPGVMRCKASARKGFKEQPGWLLDCNGQFVEFQPTGYARAWLRILSPIVQFVEAEFSVSAPRRISVGELADRIATVKDRYAEAPIAKDLRRHLMQYSSDAVVDRAVLEEWPL